MENQYSRSFDTVSWQKHIRCHLNGCGCSSNPFIWVSEKLRCVYFEIPKTGSASLKAILKKPELGFTPFWDAPTNAATKYHDYCKFAVIRHPVSRILSNYKMFCLSDRSPRHKQIEGLFGKAHNQISLDDFIELAMAYPNHHWEKMVCFLPVEADSGSCARLDRCLFTETLESDWRDLQRELGIQYDLPWNNSSANIRHQVELNDTERIIIETRYAEDLMLYDKCKSLAHAREREHVKTNVIR